MDTDLPFEIFLDAFENAIECEHCRHPLMGGELGDSCRVCSKAVMGRQLRQSTLDQAQTKYGEEQEAADPDFELELANAMPVQSDPTSLRTSSCIQTVGASGLSRLAGSKPKLTDISADDKATILSEITVCDDADSVLEEFKTLLRAEGYTRGRGDGNLRKYPGYLKMLFDSGEFASRSDLFADGAKAKAYSVYNKIADEKSKQPNMKTTAKRYVTNFRQGFDRFVSLATANAFASTESPSPPTLSEDSGSVSDTTGVNELLNTAKSPLDGLWESPVKRCCIRRPPASAFADCAIEEDPLLSDLFGALYE